jgi:hypothetical protein
LVDKRLALIVIIAWLSPWSREDAERSGTYESFCT